MPLLNPYLDFFRALPPSFRRDPSVPPSTAAQLNPDWLAYTAATARYFAWAVPTDEAIAVIRKHAPGVVELGAGSGYWAWMMRQAGIDVAAFDLDPPPFTWSEVNRSDERAAYDHPGKALLLCWPPWATGMASRALEFLCVADVVFRVYRLGRDPAVVHARRPADGLPQTTRARHRVMAPDRPGAGVEWNEDAVRRCRFDG